MAKKSVPASEKNSSSGQLPLYALLLFATIALPLAFNLFRARNSAVSSLTKSLTLEQKIGQMIVADFRRYAPEGDAQNGQNVTECTETVRETLQRYRFGGVILFEENITDTEQLTRFTDALQKASTENGGIPLLIMTDQEGGSVNRLAEGTALCGNMALCATGNTENAREAGRITGTELKAMGVNVDLAPVADVNSDPGNPVIGLRAFSDDPALCGDYAAAFSDGLHEAGVLSALKHFPGHGDTDTDSHSALPYVNKSHEELQSCELVPFRKGIAAGADVIMAGHIAFPAVEKEQFVSRSTGESVYLPASLSKTMLTDVLRGELGFQGLICTDALTMQAVRSHFYELDAAKLAINAGADLLLMPVQLYSPQGIRAMGEYIDGIAAMVRAGEISEKTIDEAVNRILTLKLEKKLFQEAGALTTAEEKVEKALAVVGCAAHREAERRITAEAVTVVKNEGVLPLTAGGSTLVICRREAERTAVEYAWGRLRREGTGVLSLHTLCLDPKEPHTRENTDALFEHVDTVVLIDAMTDPAALWGENEAGAIMLEDTALLLSAAREAGKKTVLLSTGLPYDTACFPEADAVVCCYLSVGMKTLPAEGSGRAAYAPNLPEAISVLFGASEAGGTLPVNVPAPSRDGGFTGEILYPRGSGMK